MALLLLLPSAFLFVTHCDHLTSSICLKERAPRDLPLLERTAIVATSLRATGSVMEPFAENKARVYIFNSSGTIPSCVDVAICVPAVHLPIMLASLHEDMERFYFSQRKISDSRCNDPVYLGLENVSYRQAHRISPQMRPMARKCHKLGLQIPTYHNEINPPRS